MSSSISFPVSVRTLLLLAVQADGRGKGRKAYLINIVDADVVDCGVLREAMGWREESVGDGADNIVARRKKEVFCSRLSWGRFAKDVSNLSGNGTKLSLEVRHFVWLLGCR